MAALLILAVIAAGAIVATIVTAARDGYSRVASPGGLARRVALVNAAGAHPPHVSRTRGQGAVNPASTMSTTCG